jgi:hypothetical protein
MPCCLHPERIEHMIYSMTDEQIMTLLQRAAAKVGLACSLFPYGAGQLETRSDGWCCLGWINDDRTTRAYDVWWHAERDEGRLVAWENVEFAPRPREFPLQEGTPP